MIPVPTVIPGHSLKGEGDPKYKQNSETVQELENKEGHLPGGPVGCSLPGSSIHGIFQARVLAAAAKSLQSCLTLCDPIDDSPPGSPVLGILQARTLEWVAISFSNA